LEALKSLSLIQKGPLWIPLVQPLGPLQGSWDNQMGVNLSNYGNALHNCRITSNSRVSSKGALVWVLGPLGQELKWHLPNPMFLALLCDWFWGTFIHKKYESLQIEDSIQLKITSTWRSCIQWYTFVGVGPLGQEHKWYLPNPMFLGFALCLICFLDWFWGPFIHTKKKESIQIEHSIQLKITSTWRSCIQWLTFVGVGAPRSRPQKVPT
jgi:sRNA-binding carbon storage regulator CsrA